MAWEMVVKQERRLCKVKEEHGYFHAWENYSKPLSASPMIGGEPAGVFIKIFGIVEFEDGVRRVDPTEIKFCDEENEMLELYNERNDTDEYRERLVDAELKEKELCPTCKHDNNGRYSSMCSWCDDFNCYQQKGE